MNNENKKINESLKLIAKSAVIVFIGIFLSKAFAYFYRIIIARNFTPADYGLFSLAIMISGWFMTLSCFGLAEGILRFASLYREKNQTDKIKFVFQRVLLILTISSTLAGIALFILSDFISINILHNPSLSFYLKVFSLVIPFTIIATPFFSILRVYDKISEFSFITNILQGALKITSLILLIFLGFNSKSIPYSFLIGTSTLLIGGFLFSRSKIKIIFRKYNLKKREKKKIMREVFNYSWPLLFLAFISSIFYWTDSLFIGIFKGATQVGLYNAAVPIAILLSMAPELFIQLFFPLVTREYAKKRSEKKRYQVISELSKQIGKWIFIINFPVFILMIFFPGAFINLLFGTEYLAATTSLRILAIGFLFTSIFRISNQLLSVLGKSKLILFDIIIASIINISLNIILIPMDKISFIDNSLGINGAAIATMVSLIVFNLLLLFQAKKYLSIVPLRRKIFRIALVSLIPLLFLFLIKGIIQLTAINLILIIIAFFLLYFFLILLTKCFDDNDIFIIKLFVKKIKYSKIHFSN